VSNVDEVTDGRLSHTLVPRFHPIALTRGSLIGAVHMNCQTKFLRRTTGLHPTMAVVQKPQPLHLS